MAWTETSGGSSSPAPTGEKINRSAIRRGSNMSTSIRDEAPATSHVSSASPMRRFYSGSKSTASHVARSQRLGHSNIGAHPAQTTRCGISAGNSTRAGSVASRHSDKRSIQAKSGRMLARSSGSAITQPASVADSIGRSRWTCRSTSTTSFRSPLRICERSRPTSFCYAKSVISSSTLGGM